MDCRWLDKAYPWWVFSSYRQRLGVFVVRLWLYPYISTSAASVTARFFLESSHNSTDALLTVSRRANKKPRVRRTQSSAGGSQRGHEGDVPASFLRLLTRTLSGHRGKQRTSHHVRYHRSYTSCVPSPQKSGTCDKKEQVPIFYISRRQVTNSLV